MKYIITAIFLFVGSYCFAGWQNPGWSTAEEVPWSTHTDWRISYEDGQILGRNNVVLVCDERDLPHGVFDLIIQDYKIKNLHRGRYRFDNEEWKDLNLNAVSTYGGQYLSLTFGKTALESFITKKELYIVADVFMLWSSNTLYEKRTIRLSISLIGFTSAWETMPDECQNAEY